MNTQPNHIDLSAQTAAQNVQITHDVTEPDDGLDFLSHDNRLDEYEKAVKHSGKVKFWKVAFPVIGCLIILGIAGALVINSMLTPDLTTEVIKIEDGGLVMENPKLNGVDKNNRPYNLSADRAVQDANNPTLVELQKINAELPLNETDYAKIQAGIGAYDAELKTLVLGKQIHIETTNGLYVDLMDADVDIEKGVLKTENAIYAKSPQAEISSNSLFVENDGKSIVFTGNVRMILYPKNAKKEEN